MLLLTVIGAVDIVTGCDLGYSLQLAFEFVTYTFGSVSLYKRIVCSEPNKPKHRWQPNNNHVTFVSQYKVTDDKKAYRPSRVGWRGDDCV